MDTVAQRTVLRFEKTVTSLEKALKLGELPEHAERDAVLLRFELTAELMPKVLQRILSERGAAPALPKDVVRSARAADIVGENEASTLLAVIDDRNRMVHDYSEGYAVELLRKVTIEYAPVLRALVNQIR
ncbi:MAG: nucleotidyltransferase substrate binding protein [bacterium]|nr:nucleotidyltransferase substrate binding protein [bacterium]